jgi:hypothetical protein
MKKRLLMLISVIANASSSLAQGPGVNMEIEPISFLNLYRCIPQPMRSITSITFILTIFIIILSVVLLLMAKRKRAFSVWLLDSCVKLNILVAGFIFLLALYRDICFHFNDDQWALHPESCFAPMLILGITWIAFVCKFFLQLRENFSQPGNGEVRENAS